jgi:hypothetical protein
MHQVFDIAVLGNCPLPELDRISRANADITFELLEANGIVREHDWFHHWYNDDEKTAVASSIAREPDGYRLRYPGLADFLISSDLKRIQCLPVQNTAEDTLRHVFLDLVLPRVLGQRGQVILHASAVQSADGKAFVFLGESGWGKSTIAASFYRKGYRLISDDCLKLVVRGGRVFGLSAYRGSRLRNDSLERLFPPGTASIRVSQYSSKQRIELPVDGSTAGVAVSGLFLLTDPAEKKSDLVEIEEVRGAAAIMSMIRKSFLLDVEDISAVSRQFGVARAIASVCPRVYVLRHPHDYNALEKVMRAIENADQMAARRSRNR